MHMAKQKQSKRIQIILFVAGFIFACGGIYLLVNGINTYVNQFEQKDWPVTTATVINVDKYRSGHKSHHNTYYNIIYQYEADGNVYTGGIYRVNAPKNLSETFEIRYNPDAPEESTRYLEPTFGIVISGVIGFIIFGFIGFRMIRSTLPKKKENAKSDDLKSKKIKERVPKTVSNSIEVMEIKQNEVRIFNEICDKVRTLKEKHPSVKYVVRLECSDNLPIRYSAWIFISLSRNRIILESGEDSGEWPDACDEIIRVKGKNKKMIISNTYKSLLWKDLEAVTTNYESTPFTYIENKKASDEMLARACRVEWIE